MILVSDTYIFNIQTHNYLTILGIRCDVTPEQIILSNENNDNTCVNHIFHVHEYTI